MRLLALLCLPFVAAADEPRFLLCAPSAQGLGSDRAVRVMVDRDQRLIVWMEPGEEGIWRRDELEILTTTPREVVAAGRRDGDSLHLVLDLVDPVWRLDRPAPPSPGSAAASPRRERLSGPCRIVEE